MGLCGSFRGRRGGHGLFLPFDGRRNDHAGRVDDVDDMDADEWPDLGRIRDDVPVDVAGHDGGDDVAIRIAGVVG